MSRDKIVAAISEYLANTKAPQDSSIHAIADKLGLDPSKVEEVVYQEYAKMLQAKSTKGLDKKELKRGVEVEREHTDNDMIARKIASDHLHELKNYYTRLDVMEKAKVAVAGMSSGLIKAKDISNAIGCKDQLASLLKSETYSGHKLHGRVKFAGMDISIENRAGSVRKGVNSDGTKWSTKMQHPYGYIRMTEGADGDHIDCYLGPNEEASSVYVVHQQEPETGDYDEDKVMLGFNNADEALDAYRVHYDEPDKFFQDLTILPIDVFRKTAYSTFKVKNDRRSL